MYGAIAGDIIGSVYEHNPTKTTDFPLFHLRSTFTDDTVLTVAIADAILTGTDYCTSIKRYARAYPNAGYGGSFYTWMLDDDNTPYGSWGNGSAMRVSPIGWAFDSLERVLTEAERSAAVTHDHPEGIKGAQATALAIFFARHGADKETIRREIAERFDYDLNRTVSAIRPTYRFDVSCQGSVPESIIAFLDSHDYESAVRNAISLGGDTDTMACIAGSIAEAFYKHISLDIITETVTRLPVDIFSVMRKFNESVLMPEF